MRALMAQQRPLIERLPQVRGRLTAGAGLAGVTWFRAGGAAEVLFKPVDLMDLQGFLARKPDDVPVTVLGVGSNLLVRDGGIPGVVLRLGRAADAKPGDAAEIGAGGEPAAHRRQSLDQRAPGGGCLGHQGSHSAAPEDLSWAAKAASSSAGRVCAQ